MEVSLENKYTNVNKAELYSSFINFLTNLIPAMEITKFKAAHDVGYKFELEAISYNFMITLSGYLDEELNVTSLLTLRTDATNNAREINLFEFDLPTISYMTEFKIELSKMIKRSFLAKTYIHDIITPYDDTTYYSNKYHVIIYDGPDCFIDKEILEKDIEVEDDDAARDFCKANLPSPDCHYYISATEEWNPKLLQLLDWFKKHTQQVAYTIISKERIEIYRSASYEDEEVIYIYSNKALRDFLHTRIVRYFNNTGLIHHISEWACEYLSHSIMARKLYCKYKR